MKFAIIALIVLSLITGCAKAPSRALPDVREYTKPQQLQALAELNTCTAPMLETFTIDYLVQRDQIRALKKGK